jgi:N-acetylglutamate synthase-like GNAT family acetyltransferase
MNIRTYTVNDRDACLQILEGNTPEFFVPKDCDELANFLDNLPGPYYIVEETGEVIACGGWAMDDDEIAVLTWGMVRHDLHRQGIGRVLLHHRLNAIREDGRANIVRIRTVQLVQGFYEHEGFKVTDVVPNGYGEGLDRVTMTLRRNHER